MSVLISGMEMPENCDQCDLCACFIWEDGMEENYRCSVTMYPLYNFDERHEHCPLIELSPHGRLIDADALNEMIDMSYPMIDRIDVHNGYAICQEMIKQLPTIIPAEN